MTRLSVILIVPLLFALGIFAEHTLGWGLGWAIFLMCWFLGEINLNDSDWKRK